MVAENTEHEDLMDVLQEIASSLDDIYGQLVRIANK